MTRLPIDAEIKIVELAYETIAAWSEHPISMASYCDLDHYEKYIAIYVNILAYTIIVLGDKLIDFSHDENVKAYMKKVEDIIQEVKDEQV